MELWNHSTELFRSTILGVVVVVEVVVVVKAFHFHQLTIKFFCYHIWLNLPFFEFERLHASVAKYIANIYVSHSLSDLRFTTTNTCSA